VRPSKSPSSSSRQTARQSSRFDRYDEPNSWITNESLGIPTDVPSGTPAVSTDYAIDKTLNYTAISRNGVGTTTVVNSRNQYTSFGGESLSYDKNGNLQGLHGSALSYDSEGHLKKAVQPDGTVLENLYDAQGRKVEEKVTLGGVAKTTDYVLSGDQVAEEYVDGNLAARYVHGRGIDEIVRAEQSGLANGTLDRTVFPIQDELGNVERLTDANGQTAERYEYEGYGKFTIFAPDGSGRSASAYAWRWLFQGRLYVPSLSAYDFRARTLWPELGRFGEEDPEGPASCTNSYQSFLSNWTVRTDPMGRLTVVIHGTFAEGQTWARPGGAFFEYIVKTLKDRVVVSFQWGGGDSHGARVSAAQALATRIRRYQFKAGEQLNIVAHSHGGNVAI
jgi:YD repeat-containing protein